LLDFIKLFCVIMVILLAVRRIWGRVCLLITLRVILKWGWLMEFIKERSPEHYEMAMKIKQFFEEET
jgi:hypothetical protein